MAYYIAREPCYLANRLLAPGDGIDIDFGKEKVPPYLQPAEPPAPEMPADSGLSDAERAELEVLRVEVKARGRKS